MGLLNKIKNIFNTHSNKIERSKQERKVLPAGLETSQTQPEDSTYSGSKGDQVVLESREFNKFDAEFHNPRLQCFYCNQIIESGRIRFFKAPGQREESAFHKRCFKKLKEGKLPGQ